MEKTITPHAINGTYDLAHGDKNGALAELINAGIGLFAGPIQTMTKGMTGWIIPKGLAITPELTWTPGKKHDPFKIVGGSGSRGSWGAAFDIGIPYLDKFNKSHYFGFDGATFGIGPDGKGYGGVAPTVNPGKGGTPFPIPIIFKGGDEPSISVGITDPSSGGGISYGSGGEWEIHDPQSKSPEESTAGKK